MSVHDSSTQSVLEQEASLMLAMDEDELSQLLGLRINAIQSDIGLSLQPSIEVELSPFEAVRLPTWVQKTVDAMIKTALEQSRNVLCSEEPDFDNIRNQLIAAMGLGGTALVLAFAAFLTSTLGIAAALATVLATIVIKKIGEPTIKAGHHTMCVELNKILEAKYSTSNN